MGFSHQTHLLILERYSFYNPFFTFVSKTISFNVMMFYYPTLTVTPEAFLRHQLVHFLRKRWNALHALLSAPLCGWHSQASPLACEFEPTWAERGRTLHFRLLPKPHCCCPRLPRSSLTSCRRVDCCLVHCLELAKTHRLSEIASCESDETSCVSFDGVVEWSENLSWRNPPTNFTIQTISQQEVNLY